ncbi:sperm-associated antigen 16 protein isoform X5 [Meriones unguiculatus]|uniref:sperm-associated antigen 16 protein isoform X5 n=1 Tax=Meriones unguiculatus TaxID=10047 RepID=UPI00293E5B3C|nr:sperm-associated antigen 16 protein isoform X5 [Meriones unguiculatus]
MAAQRGVPPMRMLEEALGISLTSSGDTPEPVAADGAYYLEHVSITEVSEDDCEYEEIPDDNFSIPEGEEDLTKAINIIQEQATDIEILISGLQASLKNTEIAHIHIPKIKAGYSCEKENKSEAPTQKGLHESKQDSGYKTKMKDDRKDSEFPTNMQPDTDLNVCDENIGPSKFDYKLNNIFRLHDLPVTCINMHPCKEFLVSCSEDRLWKMVGLPKGNVFLTGSGHTDWLADCCFHPSGTKLATSSGDSTIKLWDLSTGECLLTFEGHSHAVWSCTWHSSGDFVASASLDMTSKIWDINSERCRYTLYGHTDSVNSIEFFPFSNTLLTASADKTLSVWDARTSKCEHSLYGHMHSINDATFTPRGHIIASCDARGVIKLWDFRNLIPIVSIDVGPSAGNEVNFDSTGRVLAQASASGIIHLLDLKTGQIHKLVGHENEVHTVVFSQDGKNMYSGGSDGTVRLWL